MIYVLWSYRGRRWVIESHTINNSNHVDMQTGTCIWFRDEDLNHLPDIRIFMNGRGMGLRYMYSIRRRVKFKGIQDLDALYLVSSNLMLRSHLYMSFTPFTFFSDCFKIIKFFFPVNFSFLTSNMTIKLGIWVPCNDCMSVRQSSPVSHILYAGQLYVVNGIIARDTCHSCRFHLTLTLFSWFFVF